MWLIQKLKGKMEPSLETKTQLNNNNNNNNQQQLPDSQLHSDPSIDKIAQAIAQDLETLVLACKHDPTAQLKQPIDDNSNNKEVEAEASTGTEAIERNRLEEVLEVEHEEVIRVLEERESVESEIGCDDRECEEGLVSVSVSDYGKSKGYHYPLRLDAEDCAYYIRTGMCKFGSNCKYNHPLRRRNQPVKETTKQKEEKMEKHGQTECKPTKEMKKQKEENVEKRGQTECKYHTSSVGCKYGKACKFNHGKGKTVKTPVVEYNFLGLPIRPGEKECPYYMRNGSCKYGPSCRFNHPDPTAVGGDDAPTTYGNDGPLPLQPAPQSDIPNKPSWSAPRTPETPAAFVPIMYPPTQNMPPLNSDWNGYQAPAPVPAHLYPNSEQGLPIPPAFFLNNQPSNTNMYTHQQQPMSVSGYPERPGQPDCSHFMKTGVCKYRASCKFNHPQSQISRNSRDQNICTYFSRHGTCKYGKACKYDHPVNYHSNSNPAEGYDGSNRPGPMIQQSL